MNRATVVTMSKRPPPCLADTAKASLDAFLHESVISRKYPAITLGAIGAQGDPVYFACEGDKVFGEPDKGQVDDGTCASTPYALSR